MSQLESESNPIPEKKNSQDKTTDSQNQESVPGRTKQSNITTNLLNDVRKLIDLSVSRGTFQPTEITDVGEVYNELTSKLNSINQGDQHQDFNLNLLINLRKIIDVSVSRGTYKGIELSSVGKVYDEYNSNLNILIDDFQFKEKVKTI